jgi:hypothetical protein
MPEHSFSRFVYCDTNIISHLAKNKHLWSRLFEFLEENDLTLGVSGAQLVELIDAKNLLSDVAKLLLRVPSALLKTFDTVLAEEVEAHPQHRAKSLLLQPLNGMLLEAGGLEKLQGHLSSEGLRSARQSQLNHAQQQAARHAELKPNFPLSKTGDYSREQADEFAWIMVMQWLADYHREFLTSFQDIKDFHPEVFLSVRLYAHVIFYKYYLGRREPNKISDFGDLGHTFFLPYCELAVMERDQCNVLNQIKRNQDTLASTAVHDIDFFRDWHWK